MATNVNFALLLVVLAAYQIQILQGSTQCGNYHEKPCPSGCWYKDISQVCKQCYECTVLGLKDGHPEECRDNPFPSYCQHDPDGKNIATSIPKVHLPDNRQGNFSQHGDRWRVFFFTEYAEENPMMTYSRVGKVCRHEWSKNSTEWVTFHKARLFCASEDDVEYNYLEHIISVTMTINSKSTSYYYGVFTKSRANNKESALCTFTTKSVMQSMRGEISDPLSDRSGTGHTFPMQDKYLPEDFTPGQCNGVDLTDWQITFMRTHSLKFNPVERENFLYNASSHFTRLLSDTQDTLGGESYVVLFIGTGDGRLLKLVQLKNGGVNVLEEILLTPVADMITELEMIQTDEGKMVRVLSATSDDPFTVPVQRCVNMSACACTQDPYCVWNLDDNLCEELSDNLSRDRFNQSVEEKHTCSRNKTHPALLITSYRLPPTTMKPATTKGQEITDKVLPAPQDDTSVSSQQDQGVAQMWVIYIVILLGVGALVTIGIVSYKKYKQRRYHTVCCVSTGEELKIRTTRTSITLEPLVDMPDISELRVIDSGLRPRVVKTFLGRIKLKFENLTPSTRYIIGKDERRTWEATTKGPRLEVLDVTKNSISVKISDWNDDLCGTIKLTSQEWSREKPLIRAPFEKILIDGLLPNIEYTVTLEITYGSPNNTSRIPYKPVRTKEETFQIESDGDAHILRWNDLPHQISELHIATCCHLSDDIKVDVTEGSVVMKNLSQVEDLTIEVKGMLQSSEYVMATLCYDARPSGACAELLCPSTMQDLIADIEFRKNLSLLVDGTKLGYLMYCETLGYNREEASVFWKVPLFPENKFLRPLYDKNEEKNMNISVKELLSNYEKLLNSKSSSCETDLQECLPIVSIMENLASFEPKCEACCVIFRRVHHKWKCRGFKDCLPQNC